MDALELLIPARISSRAGDVLTTETGIIFRPESRYRESVIARLRRIYSRTTGGGIMFEGSRPQVNRALENGEKPSEFGFGSELRCNPDNLRVELAGYWSHLLLRVKKQSEVVDREQSSEEVRS
jgi:hypothetical protein